MKFTTQEVAEHMLNTAQFYTAATLSHELGISISTASGKLYNIKSCKKYKTIAEGRPVAVKVVDIQGALHHQQLWKQLLRSDWAYNKKPHSD